MTRLSNNSRKVPFINIHTHTSSNKTGTFEIINKMPGTNLEVFPSSWYSIGLHPWYINQKRIEDNLIIVDKHARLDNFLAIGETGLDKACKTQMNLQSEIFEWHIKLAEEINKPLIIHCVKAWPELLAYRKKFQKVPWIFHGFNASIEMAEKLIQLKCYLSFGKSLTKMDSKGFQTYMKLKNLNYTFLETDDEKLLSIKTIFELAVNCREIELSSLKDILKLNFLNCFKLNLL